MRTVFSNNMTFGQRIKNNMSTIYLVEENICKTVFGYV